MTETPIIKIEDTDDLKKILFLQRTITRKASDELEAIASDNLIDTNPNPVQVKQFMVAEAELLATYANRPTLSEWASQGGINRSGIYAEASTWGATFGVTILVGELILEQVCNLHRNIPLPTVKGILLLLLSTEIQAQAGGGVAGRIDLSALQFNVLEGNIIKDKIQASLSDAAKTLVTVGTEYGLFEIHDQETYSITNIGVRVFLHMQDVVHFVNAVTDAHKRFQNVPLPPVGGTYESLTSLMKRKAFKASPRKPTS